MNYSVIYPIWNHEYEPHTTPYTLTVYTPPRPPSWLPAFITRETVSYKNYVSERDFRILPDPLHYPYEFFGPAALETMKTKQITIKSHHFPAEMRCQHLRGKSTVCKRGCYFLEKPIKKFYSKCKRVDCEGHVFSGRTMENEDGVACFGKKGQRLVAVVPNTATYPPSLSETIEDPYMENMASILDRLKDFSIDAEVHSESSKAHVDENTELSPRQLSVINVQLHSMHQEIEELKAEVRAMKWSDNVDGNAHYFVTSSSTGTTKEAGLVNFSRL